MNIFQKSLALLLTWSLVIATAPGGSAYVNQPAQSDAQPTNPSTTQSPQELQQLVAPIALYPDALVSQILAGATYPTEIVEADRWMQGYPNLAGQELANEVDKQPWDPSVKALTQFPSVLASMDKNLSWTSSLGDAYANEPQDVMDAVQVLRARAQQAGNLKNNKQEKVETQGNTIIIEPAEPEVVYVPTYDPWIVYGTPVVAWPGWYWYPGLYVPGPGIGFGLGFGFGFLAGFAWGWHHWGCDWGHRTVIYNHTTYISHSTTIVNRDHFTRTTNNFNHTTNNLNHGQAGAQHGPSGQSGVHSGAFGGFNHGAVSNGFSARGRSSFGGEFHGGGFHGGGRR
jgi:hypothetical protein